MAVNRQRGCDVTIYLACLALATQVEMLIKLMHVIHAE